MKKPRAREPMKPPYPRIWVIYCRECGWLDEDATKQGAWQLAIDYPECCDVHGVDVVRYDRRVVEQATGRGVKRT